MTCRQSENLLQGALDAPLTSAERARLDAHLETCPHCRRAQREYRLLTRTAAQWVPRPEPAALSEAEFTAQVMAQVTVPQPRPQDGHSWLTAVLALAAFVGLSLAASPLLPALPLWRPAWDGLSAPGLWTEMESVLSVRWAEFLLPPALAANALLLLRARRSA